MSVSIYTRLLKTTALAITLLVGAAQVCKAEEAVLVPVPVEEHFGRSGQFFLSGSTAFELGRSSVDNNWDIAFNPRAGIFVSQWIYLQLAFNYDFTYYDAPTANKRSVVGVGPGVGVNVPLSRTASFAPSVSLLYSYTSQTISISQTSPDYIYPTNTQLHINVDLPFQFELTKHFSLAVGPVYRRALLNRLDTGDGPKANVFQVRAGLIGWF